MKVNSQRSPNLPAMAIVMTASLMFAGILFLFLGMLFHENFQMNRTLAYRAAAGLAVGWIIGSAIHITRSPKYQGYNITERVFHWWQGIVLACVMAFSYLRGVASSPGYAWAIAGIECILVLFYVCYVGFALLLRRRLPLSSYVGLFLVLLSAIYAVWKAPK